MNHQVRAKWMMVSSMAIFGTVGAFVRNIPLSSGEIALWRAVLATVLIGSFLLITHKPIPFRAIRKQLPLLLFSGMALGLNWILLFEAYKYTSVSAATLSYYFAPVIVTLVCSLLLHEKMGAKQWLCFIMSTIGIVLITGLGNIRSGNSHHIGILCGLGAAVLYATVILLNKFIRDVDGIHRTFLQFLASLFALIPYVALTDGFRLDLLSGIDRGCLLIVGLVHTGITYCLYFTSLKELPGQKVAILSYIDPLVAILVSVLLLHERMTAWQILGGMLILGFTCWNEISSTK